MQKILALLVVLAGIGGGAVLGVSLRPDSADPEEKSGPAEAPASSHGAGAGSEAEAGAGAEAEPGRAGHGAGGEAGPTAYAPPAGEHGETEGRGSAAKGGPTRAGTVIEVGDREYVSIGRQMIIPVVEGGTTRALMLFELAVEVPRGETERVYQLEPRLRDAFLRVLFEMSHTGAFLDTYTDERIVEELRGKLRAAARRYLGEALADVLILDIVRQEL